MKTESGSKKIVELAWKFLEKNEGCVFERKEIENFIKDNSEVLFTKGQITGSLNRLLIEKGPSLGITKVNHGEFCYVEPDHYKQTVENVQNLFNETFTKAMALINEASDLKLEEKINLYSQLARAQEEIKNGLNGENN